MRKHQTNGEKTYRVLARNLWKYFEYEQVRIFIQNIENNIPSKILSYIFLPLLIDKKYDNAKFFLIIIFSPIGFKIV